MPTDTLQDNPVAKALNQFDHLCTTWGAAYGTMEKLGPYMYKWTPPDSVTPSKKGIALTLQAITHGNEVGGILALVECLKTLRSGLLKPSITLAFTLGNPAAALADRRFVESDLNRAFGAKADTAEARRAKELQRVLGDTDYLLDIHQTIESCSQPFFIFPYSAAGLAFAGAAHPDVCVVTHWGQSFSLDGMCTDEYVNHCGGTGITIELGKKGFDPYQTSVGFQACLGAVRYAQKMLLAQFESAIAGNTLYTWKAIELYEEGMDLKEGLYNFQPVKKGDVLGTQAGSKPLLARESGWLLFPKYHRDPKAPRAREIYRIAKRIEADQLGQSGVVGV